MQCSALSGCRVGVIGVGRVGSVIAARLSHQGFDVVVSARSEASQLRAATIDARVLHAHRVAQLSDVLILSVPDDVLADLCAELVDAGVIASGRIVAHTSGRHGLAALQAAESVGARVLALHPAMTFPGTPASGAQPIDCVWGLTSRDADRSVALALVEQLGGRPMWVDDADRVTYHAALAHSANHLVTLVAQARELLTSIDASVDPAEVLRPLLTAALDNALELGDAALTGPVSRGDVDTVAAHVQALRTAGPDTRAAYTAMAAATARRVGNESLIAPALGDAEPVRGAESSRGVGR